MQYADALPALIKDNIGDAPLTVCLFECCQFIFSPLSLGLGLDFHLAENDPDRGTIALSQTNLEVFG